MLKSWWRLGRMTKKISTTVQGQKVDRQGHNVT